MGHKKAALALFKAFEERKDEAEVEIIDVMEYASRFYRFLYLDFYVFLMQRAKWLWGAMYYFSNSSKVDAFTRSLRERMDFKGAPELGRTLKEKSPDAIVATHFFLPSIAGILKSYEGFRSKLFTVITDYGPHSYWLSDHIDRFFVGSDSALKEVVKRGVPEGKIDVTGIPTTEEFHRYFDADKLKEKYGLDKTKKTVFLMSGGFGVGPAEEILLQLNKCHMDIQVITVCGHNRKAHKEVSRLKEKLSYPVILFGFTDKVAELMAVSDLMITKAGGISVTEALDSRLPMILFASMPGQETWNEELLVSRGAAKKAFKVEEIPFITDDVLSSESIYASMKENIEKLRKPYAAEDIVKIIMKETSGD